MGVRIVSNSTRCVSAVAHATTVTVARLECDMALATIAAVAPIVPSTVTIVMRSLLIIARSRSTTMSRTPVVTITISIIPVAVAVVHIVVVVVTQARSPVVMMVMIIMSVVRVTKVTVVIHMQVVGQPADRERGCHAPEMTGRK